MKKLKVFKKEITLDESFFEISFVSFSIIITLLIAAPRKPQYLPVGYPQYIALLVLLGFVIGFVLGGFLIWLWKKLRSR